MCRGGFAACDVAPVGDARAQTHTQRHNERAEKGGRGGPPTSLIVQQVKEEGSGGWGYSDKQQLVQ